jgi:hypothetical protein
VLPFRPLHSWPRKCRRGAQLGSTRSWHFDKSSHHDKPEFNPLPSPLAESGPLLSDMPDLPPSGHRSRADVVGVNGVNGN